MVLCDATRPESLDNIEHTWLPLVKSAFNNDQCKSALLVVTKGNLLSAQDLDIFKDRLAQKYIESFRVNFPFLHDTYE